VYLARLPAASGCFLLLPSGQCLVLSEPCFATSCGRPHTPHPTCAPHRTPKTAGLCGLLQSSESLRFAVTPGYMNNSEAGYALRLGIIPSEQDLGWGGLGVDESVGRSRAMGSRQSRPGVCWLTAVQQPCL